MLYALLAAKIFSQYDFCLLGSFLITWFLQSSAYYLLKCIMKLPVFQDLCQNKTFVSPNFPDIEKGTSVSAFFKDRTKPIQFFFLIPVLFQQKGACIKNSESDFSSCFALTQLLWFTGCWKTSTVVYVFVVAGVCVCVCVRACVRAGVRACVCVCGFYSSRQLFPFCTDFYLHLPGEVWKRTIHGPKEASLFSSKHHPHWITYSHSLNRFPVCVVEGERRVSVTSCSISCSALIVLLALHF